MNILVGYNSGSEDFEEKLATQLRKSGIDVESVTVRNLKSSVMEYARDHRDSLGAVIIAENLEGASPYLVKDVEALTALNDAMKVVLIVSDSHKGDKFMSRLFANGYYTAIFQSEGRMSKIAELIKNGRSRRLAKAYYGVTGTQVNEVADGEVSTNPVPEAVVPSSDGGVGSAPAYDAAEPQPDSQIKSTGPTPADSGAPSYEESGGGSYRHLTEGREPIKSTMERIREQREQREQREEEERTAREKEEALRASLISCAPTQSVGIICSGCPRIATYLAMDLARMTSAGGTASTYFEMPYPESDNDKGDDGAYMLFGLDGIPGGFVSHMQSIMDGGNVPSKRNMLGGVSVICPNPVTDVLDSWSLIDTYKALYNIAGPVFVNMGGKFLYSDVAEFARTCTAIIVIVPHGESSAAYVTYLKDSMGLGKDTKLITISETEGFRYSELSGFTEIGCPELFADGYRGAKTPDEYAALDKVLSQLGFKHSDIIPSATVQPDRKKFLAGIRKKKQNHNTSSREIAVYGSQEGAGSTYNTVAAASVIADKGYRVAVIDESGREGLLCMGGILKRPVVTKGDYPYFSYKGADYYFNRPYESISDLKGTYDFIIIDYGTKMSASIQDADFRLCALIPGAWNCDILHEYLEKAKILEKPDTTFYTVYGYGTKELTGYRKLFRKKNIYGMPYCREPGAPTDEIKTLIAGFFDI